MSEQNSESDFRKDAFERYEAHNQIVNTLWNFFIVVAAALMGLIWKEMPESHWLAYLFLSLAFLGFAHGNRTAMMRSHGVIVAASNVLQNCSSSVPEVYQKLLLSHRVPEVAQLTKAHWLFTIGVVIGIWSPKLIAMRCTWNCATNC